MRAMSDEDDDLTSRYRDAIRLSVAKEAARRIAEVVDPIEEARLLRASLISLAACSTFGGDPELVHGDMAPALMSRLGEVRAALTGHGGGLVVINAQPMQDGTNPTSEVEDDCSDGLALSLTLSLDGACIACGAAPGTLSGIRDDLLADSEVGEVSFDRGLLEHYDDLAREFLEVASGVTFV